MPDALTPPNGTFAALTRLHNSEQNVRVVRLRRNFGKAADGRPVGTLRAIHRFAVAFLGLWFLFQLVEGNVLVPLVMRNTIGISPFLVILSILGPFYWVLRTALAQCRRDLALTQWWWGAGDATVVADAAAVAPADETKTALRIWSVGTSTNRVLATFPMIDRMAMDPTGQAIAISVQKSILLVGLDGRTMEIWSGGDPATTFNWSSRGDYLAVTTDQAGPGRIGQESRSAGHRGSLE